MSEFPKTGFVRLKQIIGDPKANPPIPALIPVSKSTIYAWIREGRFPTPIHLGDRLVAWRVEDIRAVLQGAKL